MAFWAILEGIGPSFYLLLGSRWGLRFMRHSSHLKGAYDLLRAPLTGLMYTVISRVICPATSSYVITKSRGPSSVFGPIFKANKVRRPSRGFQGYIRIEKDMSYNLNS